MAWLLWLMLLAFLACSIGLAHAEPDTTSSTNTESENLGLGARDSGDGRDGVESDRDGVEGDRVAGDGVESGVAGDGVESDGDGVAREGDGVASDGDGDGDGVANDGDASDGVPSDGVATDGLEDAQVDDPAPASIESATLAPTWAHGVDAREAVLRRHTSWLGRIDVSITWRMALNESTGVRRDEVWLVGTWRL